MSGIWDRLINKLLPRGRLLQFREDASVPGRVITGYAKTGALQTEPVWHIRRLDTVGTQKHGEAARLNGVETIEFVHKWSDRKSLFPQIAFLNEKSIQFIGTGDSYATVNNSPDLNFANTDEFSISIWWKSPVEASRTLIQKTSTTGGNNGYTIDLDGSGRVTFQFRGDGLGDRIRVRTDSFTGGGDGDWHNIVVTKASGSTAASSVTVWIDGLSHKAPGQGGDFDFNIQNDTLTGDTTSVGILAVAANISGGSNFFGNIDEVAIHNAELTSDEVAEIYNENKGVIDLKTGSGQISSAGVSWWRMGDLIETFPTIPDQFSTNNMTLQADVKTGDVETEVPP